MMRHETDLLGQRTVPRSALYGIHALRAVENFPITGAKLSHFPQLVRALARVKLASARANAELGVVSSERHAAIEHACALLLADCHHDAFVVDMLQGGAGTSTNMNSNEVIANLGLVHLGRALGDYVHLHPDDHVNRSQSKNDVYWL